MRYLKTALIFAALTALAAAPSAQAEAEVQAPPPVVPCTLAFVTASVGPTTGLATRQVGPTVKFGVDEAADAGTFTTQSAGPTGTFVTATMVFAGQTLQLAPNVGQYANAAVAYGLAEIPPTVQLTLATADNTLVFGSATAQNAGTFVSQETPIVMAYVACL